jgi:hypothetical protein
MPCTIGRFASRSPRAGVSRHFPGVELIGGTILLIDDATILQIRRHATDMAQPSLRPRISSVRRRVQFLDSLQEGQGHLPARFGREE